MRDMDEANAMSDEEFEWTRALVLDGQLNPLTYERIEGGYQEVLDLIEEGAYRVTGYAETEEETEALKRRTLKRITDRTIRRAKWDAALKHEERKRKEDGLPLD